MGLLLKHSFAVLNFMEFEILSHLAGVQSLSVYGGLCFDILILFYYSLIVL